MGFLLNQGGHLHSHSHGGHGHSHGPASGSQSSGPGQQQKSHGSLAVRAAFIHAVGDLLQSVGVLIAAYIVRFKVRFLLQRLKLHKYSSSLFKLALNTDNIVLNEISLSIFYIFLIVSKSHEQTQY